MTTERKLSDEIAELLNIGRCRERTREPPVVKPNPQIVDVRLQNLKGEISYIREKLDEAESRSIDWNSAKKKEELHHNELALDELIRTLNFENNQRKKL